MLKAEKRDRGRHTEIPLLNDMSLGHNTIDVAQGAADPFLLTNYQGDILDVNGALCQMLGYSREELVSMNLCNIDPDFKGFHKRIIDNPKELNKAAGIYSGVRQRRKDGQIINVHVSLKYLDIGEGFFVCSLRDNSKQKRLYLQLEESEDSCLLLTNFQGNILDANDAFCQMLGYSHEELVSMNLIDIDPDFKGFHNRIIENPRELNEAAGIYSGVRQRRKDGQIIDVYVSLKYLDIGEGFFLSSIRDNTDQKKLYIQLRESEDRYRALINLGTNIGEAVIMLQDTYGCEGIHIFASDKWLDMTGYSKDELLNMSFFDLVKPADRKASIQRHRQKMTNKPLPELFELSITRKDGTEVPLEITSAYSMYNNQPVNVVYIRDITEHKRIEKKLKQYQERLEDLVEKRTEELAEANKKLQLQMQQRADFTNALVHELKTPLTPMLGASEILMNKLQDDKSLQRIARNINKSAHSLNHRINDLIDLAKGEVGLLKIRREPTDPHLMLMDIWDYIKPEAGKKNQSLLLDLPPSLPTVYIDEERIRQVILNLLNNAFKFTRTDGEIGLSVETRDSSLIIHISDNGCGISRHDRLNLFDSYKTRDDGEDSLGGLGIGLPLSKLLVGLHGGKIWVKSRKNTGSTFSFSIPLN